MTKYDRVTSNDLEKRESDWIKIRGFCSACPLNKSGNCSVGGCTSFKFISSIYGMLSHFENAVERGELVITCERPTESEIADMIVNNRNHAFSGIEDTSEKILFCFYKSGDTLVLRRYFSPEDAEIQKYFKNAKVLTWQEVIDIKEKGKYGETKKTK